MSIFMIIVSFVLLPALLLSSISVFLGALFISIKKKQCFSDVLFSDSSLGIFVLFTFILTVLFASICSMNYDEVPSYSIIDNSSCLCTTTTLFFGKEYDSEVKLCSYVELDGLYYLIKEDNSLLLIEFDS